MMRPRRRRALLIGVLAGFALAGAGLAGCAHGIVTGDETAGIGWLGDDGGGNTGWGWQSDAVAQDVAAIKTGMAREREIEAEEESEMAPLLPDAAAAPRNAAQPPQAGQAAGSEPGAAGQGATAPGAAGWSGRRGSNSRP